MSAVTDVPTVLDIDGVRIRVIRDAVLQSISLTLNNETQEYSIPKNIEKG